MRSAQQYGWVASDPLNSPEIVRISPVSSVREMYRPAHKPLSRMQQWGYGLLLFGFVFAGIQAIRCGVMSAAKLEGLVRQRAQVNTLHHQAKTQNALLKDKISLYASPLGVEEMARENLGMVSKDEILVRVYPAALAQKR